MGCLFCSPSFLYMRRLYIATGTLCNAIKFQKDGALDVLAFCVQAKRIYTKSIIYNPSKRHLMEVFHIGYGKLCNILDMGIKDGYFHYDEKSGVLIFHRLAEPKCWKVGIDFEDRDYTLTEIKDILRELFTANTIKLQQNANHRHTIGAAASKSVDKELKRKSRGGNGNPKRRKATHCNKGFSLSKLAKINGISKSKMRKLRNSALSKGLIRKIECLIKTELTPSDDMKAVNAWFRKLGGYGYLLRGKGEFLMCQLQNIYRVNNDKLLLSYARK